MTTPDYAYRFSIQSRVRELIDDMISCHNKVLPIRLDLHFPDGYWHNGGNDEIEQFNKRLAQHYRYHGLDIRYLAVREQNISSNPHYHVLVLVDGNKHQHPAAVHGVANHIWKGVVDSKQDGLVNFCYHQPNHPIPALEVIRRPSANASGDTLLLQQAQFDRAVSIALAHADYLAKEMTKGNAPDGVREMLASQVRARH